MKKSILLLTYTLVTMSLFSQVPYWAWAKGIAGSTGNTYDRGTSIATDASGNVIMVGCFCSPTITFGPITLSNSTNYIYNDLFIAKFDTAGNVLWAKSYGGIYNDVAISVATDDNGNIIMVGNFISPSLSFGTTTLTNNGGYDIFIVKFDSSGNIIWAKSEGGSSDDNSSNITIDNNGNIIILANYTSPTIIIGTNTLTNKGNCDILLAKYSSSGNVLWTKSIGGTSTDYGYSVATDNTGNIGVTGNFISPSITDGVFTLTNTKNKTMYLIKYNSSGIYKWSDSWSGGLLSTGRSVAFDDLGNILLLGHSGDTLMTFGSITLTCHYVSSFLIKYNSIGNVTWAITCADGKIDGYNIAIDTQGSIFLIGEINCPTVPFGSGYLFNAGVQDIIIGKYDNLGNEKWGKEAGGSSSDYGSIIATYKNGNVVALGTYFSDSITFGSNTLLNPNIGHMGIYLSKLNTASTIGIEETKIENNFSIYPNPVSSQVNIEFEEFQKNITIKLLDELGNEIRVIDFSGMHLKIEKGELNSGLYFIQTIDVNNNVSIKKLIIQ